MNKEELINEIKILNIPVDEEKLDLLDKYKDYLKEYNNHTNLTRIIEDEDIYLKHFYDSLTITKAIDFNKINSLLDIGTGAGFPGMIIKIFYPHLDVTLLDSNNKKTKFLEKLSNMLNIKVNIVNDRVENYAKNNLNSYDLVTSRAVANLRVLSELSIPLVKEEGLFIAMKAGIDGELDTAKDTISILDSKIIDIISFNLYKGEGLRNLIVIKKIKRFNKENLRSYDKIIKKPLVKHQ